MIPTIDVSAFYGPPSAAREAADRAILAAAAEIGFMTITGLDGHAPVGAEVRARLLRLFSLPEAEKRQLLRRKFAPERPNVYRGFFPLQGGGATYKEGIDIGPDLVDPAAASAGGDPLLEPTPLPPEEVLPGWRADAAAYYRGMEGLGRVILRSLARGLGLPDSTFDDAFAGGISTLRLIRYPERTETDLAEAQEEDVWVVHQGHKRYLSGVAHVDSGFVTLLAQDGVEGLQARAGDGSWIDVPPAEGSLAVNFGALLERWTGGRICATEHRILGPGRERCSIPFFFEPRADALIAPLPITGSEAFQPFHYGDHLWQAMMRFVEFRGLEHLRKPLAA